MDREVENTNHSFRNALIIGASGGIGSAVATHLETTGTRVQRVSRSLDALDLKKESAIAKFAATLLSDSSEHGEYDLIFLATGVLEAAGARPEKSFAELDPQAMSEAFAINVIGPALCIKHFAEALTKDGPCVFAALSARVGSIGDNRLGGWMSYRSSKAALNQIIRCAAIELNRTRPNAAVVALHPGTIETELTRRYAKGNYTARPIEAAQQLTTVLSQLTSKDTGRFLAYDGTEIDW